MTKAYKSYTVSTERKKVNDYYWSTIFNFELTIQIIQIFDCFAVFVLLFHFFYLGFLSQTFRIHRIAGAGGDYFFNSSLPLSPASQTLRP